MFNNDFYELKKALEVVTLEVTDLKNQLHQKSTEIQNLQFAKSRAEQMLQGNNTTELKQKLVEQDIRIRELKLEKEQSEKKNTQLRLGLQSVNDRISGLVKENDLLKKEAIARQVMSRTFNGVKGFVENLKSKQ
jgi:predicted  nucleic acid-binding Zn-ribbon protein